MHYHIQSINLQQLPANMQAIESLSALSFQVGCLLCILITILFLFVKLVAWITGWHLIGIALLAVGIIKLLRTVGMFALYPGCFSYVKSDIEIKQSRRIRESLSNNLKGICWYFELMSGNPGSREHFVSDQFNPASFVRHIRDMIRMYERFQPSLTPNKKQLLSVYRKMNAALIIKVNIASLNQSKTIEQLLVIPSQYYQQIKLPTQVTLINQCMKREIMPLIQQLVQAVKLFPEAEPGFLKSFVYRVSTQKLYQIRFCYFYWEQQYEFSHYLIPSPDSQNIEAALVEGHKNEQPVVRNRAVLLCCPNGAYFQYFLFDCQYTKMYLDLGYKIVLWNYRGYGQSTGTPSLCQSLQDVETVYGHFRNICNIEIVHGYSIGGPPAVYLAHKHPQIRTLVVDRSFCSFVNIAEEISPILSKLARLAMKADSEIRMSEYYLQIRNCNKVIIWSPVDQVISNGSSLKMGVLMKMRHRQQQLYLHDRKPSSPKSTLLQEQLAETDTFIDDSSPTRASVNLIAKSNQWIGKLTEFFQSLSTIHQQLKKNIEVIRLKQKIFRHDINNSSLMEQIPASQQLSAPLQNKHAGEGQAILSSFWYLVSHLDGGGTRMQLIKQIVEQGQARRRQLIVETKSFVLGLLYFGTCYHEKKGESVLTDWNHTTDVLDRTERNLDAFYEQNHKKVPQLVELLRAFAKILREIHSTVSKSPKPNEKELGILIPTDSGHNGHLTQKQFSYFYSAIRSFKTVQ